jgi:hypothetical protein
LLVVNVMGYVPAVPAAGMPAKVPVPFLLSKNVTPLGSAPVSVKDGTGKPVAVTGNVPAVPTVNAVLLALLIAGGWSTVNVKVCVASVPIPLWALTVIVYVPPVPAPGVPLRVAVPFPLSVKATPIGSVPDSLRLGAGKPVVVTEKVPTAPTVKVVPLALVMAGGWPSWLTVRVKLCVAVVPTPLLAVNVIA